MKKIYSIILALVIITALFATTAYAREDYTWEHDGATDTFYNGVNTYERYDIFDFETIDAEIIYVFTDPGYKNDSFAEIYMLDTTDEIIYLVSDYEYNICAYVTEKGREMLDAFHNGNYTKLRLRHTYNYETAELDISFLNKLDENNGETKVFDVKDLEKLPCFELDVFDESDSLSKVYGAVYLLGEEYYYINYNELDNSYFDSYGVFSYRRGEVEAVKLNKETAQMITSASHNLEYRESEYIYEDEATFEFGDMTAAQAQKVFVALSLVAGFILPVIPFVLGLVLANSKKLGKPRRWYLVSALSLLWMLLAGVIILIII